MTAELIAYASRTGTKRNLDAPWIVCALLEHAPWMRPLTPGPRLHAVRVYESSTTWCEVNASEVDYRG